MERSVKCFATFVALFVVALGGTAQAAWEAPKRVDTSGEDRGSTTAGEIAVGANGLASIFFFQSTDSGTVRLFTRRGADQTDWSTPVAASFTQPTGDEKPPEPNGPPELEANDAGTTGTALRVNRNIKDLPEPDINPDDAKIDTIFGGGWPAAVSIPPSLKNLLGSDDPADAATSDKPDVDVDGKNVGHVVAIIDPAGDPGKPDPPTPPSDAGPRLEYNAFNTSTSDPVAGQKKTDFVATGTPSSQSDARPFEPASKPRIDVNEDGDVAVSFVAEVNPAQLDEQRTPDKLAVFVARKLDGTWAGPVQMSQKEEGENVTEHDVAIDKDGTITLLVASNPGEGSDRLYAHRWLHTASGPRNVYEFVSSSDATRTDVTGPRIVADDSGRLTAAWLEGTRLSASERTSNWSQPSELSTTAAAFDVAVDTAGTATLVYRETTKLLGRSRATGTQWGGAEQISTAAVDATVAPRVDARKENQADVFWVQANGSVKSAYASRGTGAPPVTPVDPPKPDTEDCAADVNVVSGSDAGETLTGSAAVDSILGRGGDDALFGLAGDDCLRGGAGNDTANGDDGNDSVAGGDGNDKLTGNNGNDTLGGGAGDDTLNGSAGDDSGTGGDGNDSLGGDDGKDVLSGEAGDDTVRGGAGDDILGGADGNDTVFGQAGANTLYGGAGNDALSGGADADTILGEDGDDTITGGAGAGNLTGAAGNDKITGGSAVDVIDGGLGDDALSGRGGKDVVRGGGENDTIRGGSGNDRLFGEDGDDRLFGDGGKNRLVGGAGNDNLRGGKKADRLFGGAGDDKIKGGGGKDRISAGAGNDSVNARDGKKDKITCGAGRDKVKADRKDKVSKSCEKVRRPRKKKRS